MIHRMVEEQVGLWHRAEAGRVSLHSGAYGLAQLDMAIIALPHLDPFKCQESCISLYIHVYTILNPNFYMYIYI